MSSISPKDPEQRTFHGSIGPGDLARGLIAEFNRGNLRAQQLGTPDHLIVQIQTARAPASGGRTGISVHLIRVEDGVLVSIGEQELIGVAASLGATALAVLAALRNPLALVTRLDDLAEDVSSLQLTSRIWQAIERVAAGLGASFEISERLRRLVCAYCTTPNAVGEAHCMACGAPLGGSQPVACKNCGHVAPAGSAQCTNCGKAM